MSVARARELIARARAAGITVHEWAGWESRGNGQTSAYQGWVNHHTGSAFGMAPSILVTGRSDLSGPLCNTAGNVDGSITIIAAHPANHAGASGGWDTAPLPRTSVFNKTVWGHEIVYPGNVPMTSAQYRTALIVSKIGIDIWGYGDAARIKFHQGTSITGKWDPGYAPGKTCDIYGFRRDIQTPPVPPPPPVVDSTEEEEMAAHMLPATGDATRKTSIGRPWPNKNVRMYLSTGWGARITGRIYAWEAGHVLRSLDQTSVDGAWQMSIDADNPAYFVVPAGVVQLTFEYACAEDVSISWLAE